MNPSTKHYRPESAAGQSNRKSNLARWLRDPRMAEYLGEACKLRLDVLAAVINGRRVGTVAREHGVTAEAARKYARRAKALFPTLRNRKLRQLTGNQL